MKLWVTRQQYSIQDFTLSVNLSDKDNSFPVNSVKFTKVFCSVDSTGLYKLVL